MTDDSIFKDQKPKYEKLLPCAQTCYASHGRNEYSKKNIFLTIRILKAHTISYSFDNSGNSDSIKFENDYK